METKQDTIAELIAQAQNESELARIIGELMLAAKGDDQCRMIWAAGRERLSHLMSAETARRLKTFGDSLHGLASVDCTAENGMCVLRVEYFASDMSREGCGNAARLFDLCADMGIIAETESPLQAGKGAFGPVEIYRLG